MAGIFDRFKDQTPAPDERLARLHALEARIETNLTQFVEAGSALCLIRDERLYKLTHERFADYVEHRFGIKVRRAYALIAGAQLADQVSHTTHATTGAMPTVTELPAEAQQAIRDVINNRTSRKKKARKKVKPHTIRVELGRVVIVAKKADTDLAAILAQALDQVNARLREAA